MKKEILTFFTTFLTSLAIVSMMVTFPSCKKKENCSDASNPKCPNYNACLTQSALTADFTMWEQTYNCYPTLQLQLDDTTKYAEVIFKATCKNADRYLWEIGAGTYTSDTLKLVFPIPNNSVVPIKLTVWKKNQRASQMMTPYSL